MANELKITLSLDTTSFRKALDEIERQAKEAIENITGQKVTIEAEGEQAIEEAGEVEEEIETIPDKEANIEADGEQAKQEAGDVEAEIEAIPDEKNITIDADGNALETVAELSLVYSGLMQIINQVEGAIGGLVEASNIQEDAENALAAALRNTGLEVEKNLEEMKEYASGIQAVTRYGDEAILSGTALAQNIAHFSEDILPDVQRAAIGLAQAYRIDLNTAFMLIGRAGVGQTQMMTRYGIVLDETMTKEEQFQDILRMGNEQFAIATEMAESGAGKLQQTANVLGDFQEQVGDFVKSALVPFANIFGDILKMLNEEPELIRAAISALVAYGVVLVATTIKQKQLNTVKAIGAALFGNLPALAAAAATGIAMYGLQAMLTADDQAGLNKELQEGSGLLEEISGKTETKLLEELQNAQKELERLKISLEGVRADFGESSQVAKGFEQEIEKTEKRIQSLKDRIEEVKKAEAEAESEEDVAKYYETIKFEDVLYFAWRKEQIAAEIEQMKISNERKEILYKYHIDNLIEEYKRFLGISIEPPVIEPPEIKQPEIEFTLVEAKDIFALDEIEITTLDRLLALGDKIQELADKELDGLVTKIDKAVGGVGDVFDAHYEYRKQLLENEMNAEIRAVQESAMVEEEKEARISNIKEKYRQKEIEAKRAMKPMQIAEAISGTALAVVNALQTKPFIPLGLIAAAAAAAEGAIQVATIKAQKYFQGVVGIEGPGTETSDSILAFLSRGESVIPAEATKKNFAVLEYINSGGVIPGFAGGYMPPIEKEKGYDFGRLEEKLDDLRLAIFEAQPIIETKTIDPVKVSRLADEGKIKRNII